MAEWGAPKRGHWCIENRTHRAKDVNFGEDASLVHLGAGPTIYAMLRAALSLLRAAGITQPAAQLRRYSRHPSEALALFLSSPARA